MRYKHLHAFIAIAMAACLLTGCRSELNLNDVDTSVEAHLKMALPIGTIKLGVGELFGISDTTSNIYIENVYVEGEDSVKMMVWKGGDTPNPKKFSFFNLTEKLDAGDTTILLEKHLVGKKYYDPTTGSYYDLVSPGLGISTIYIPTWANPFSDSLVFDMDMSLRGINSPNATERVDSAQLPVANFKLAVENKNFSDLKWDWIDAIYMDLGPNFDLRGGSKRITLYDGTGSTTWGTEMQIPLSNVALKLMKDESKRPGRNNADDAIHVKTIVYYHIAPGTTAKMQENSGVRCAFGVKEFNVSYIWGWFSPSNQMSDADSIKIGNLWDNMPMFQTAVLPFSRPKIEVSAETQVAGAIRMHGHYMKSWDVQNNEHTASFNGKQSFDSVFNIPPCADPAGPLNAVTNLDIFFDNSEQHGRIDKLFEGGVPTRIKYQFQFDFDSVTCPQIRIPTDTYVQLKSKFTLPMAFKEGAHLEHSAKLEGIDVSQFNVDSLFGKAVKLDSTSVYVIMKTENTIPLRVKLRFKCFDQYGDSIVDPVTKQAFAIFDDGLFLEAPEFTKDASGKWVGTPRIQTNTASLVKEQLDLFPKISAIKYSMVIDDESLKDAYEKGLPDVQIRPYEQSVKLIIGLTADVQAAIQLNQNK